MQITTLRLPQDLLDRADELIPTVARIPEMAAGGEVLRSDVLRLALARGLAALETQATSNPPQARTRRSRKR